MHGFGHSGKSNKIFEGPSSRTRSKTSEKGKDYCNCPKSPETAIDKLRAGSRDLTHTAKMANVEEKLAQLQDLFNKRYDQIGETLESVQASLNEPSNSAPVKAKLESFSGYENQDINRWLVKFSNRLALRHKKSDPKAAAADLSFHLAGPAETWYYSLDPSVRDNYDALKAALLKRFSNQDLEWRLRQKLSSRKQGESESLDTYVDFLSNTCQRLGVSDQDKMHYFVQGLREDIKRDVLMQKPKTFEEAESVARLKVSVERTLLDDRSSVPNSDPEKAVLYKMLENLMPNSKEPKSDASAKVAAFVPQKAPDLGMEFQKLRTELSREIRDELRAVKDGICNNQGPQGGKFFPPNNHMGYSRDPTMGRRNFQGGGGRNFAGGGNNTFQRGGRRLDGKPVCFRCNRTGHVARNCQVNVSMRDQYNPRKPPNPHRQDPRIAVLRNDTCHAPDYNGDTCHPFAPSLDDTMVTEPEVVPWEPAPHAGTCPESPCVTPIQQQLDPNKVTPVAANQLHQDDVPKEPEEPSSTVMENNPSVLQFSENTFNIPKDLSVKGEALGFTVNCLVDTGAAISVISTEFLHKSHEGRKLKLKDSQIKTVNTVSGEQLAVLGQVSVPIKIQSNLYECEAHVISNLGYDLVLGRDFLRKTKAVINLGDNTLRLQQDDEQATNTAPSYTVRAVATFVIPPRSEVVIPGKLQGDAACALGQVETFPRLVERYQLHGAAVLARASPSNTVPVRLLNPTSKPTTIYRETTLGVFQECGEGVAVINLDKEDASSGQPNCAQIHTEQRKSSESFVDLSNSNLTSVQKSQLADLLQEFRDVFALKPEELGRTSLIQHEIDTGDNPPIRLRPYRAAQEQRERIAENINDMLARDIIQPSTSPWAAPVVLVKKKDGTDRFCVDYRKLNEVTKKDSFPLPRIDDTLDALHGTQFFSTMDLMSGYWQVELAPEAREKTAFTTYNGLFEFLVLPFGLTNAPATFQRLMDCILRGLTWQICLIYLDDVIVFSKTFNEHLANLRLVFERFRQAGIKLKPSKCQFGRGEVPYLGHIVSKDGVKPDPAKIRAVQEFPTPRNIHEVRSFLGLANYYRKFVKGFCQIAAHLWSRAFLT